MNHKVFRSVFVLAVALGIISVTARIKDEPQRPMKAVDAAKEIGRAHV